MVRSLSLSSFVVIWPKATPCVRSISTEEVGGKCKFRYLLRGGLGFGILLSWLGNASLLSIVEHRPGHGPQIERTSVAGIDGNVQIEWQSMSEAWCRCEYPFPETRLA